MTVELPAPEGAALATRLRLVLDEVAAACAHAKRPRGAVTLVAVSKGQPAAAIRAAFAAGQRHFGENYAAEWQAKQAELRDLEGLIWHFVGRVQRGNAKAIAAAALVHGVGSTSQAEALAKEGLKSARRVPVLLQVNLLGEDTKNGFTAVALEQELPALRALDGIEPCGLMSMPLVAEGSDVGPAFADVRRLRDRLCPEMPELSLGMSSDFAVGIAEGATLVRVGTRIFGARSIVH